MRRRFVSSEGTFDKKALREIMSPMLTLDAALLTAGPVLLANKPDRLGVGWVWLASALVLCSMVCSLVVLVKAAVRLPATTELEANRSLGLFTVLAGMFLILAVGCVAAGVILGEF